MTKHLEIGNKGEQLAALWLQENGYKIIERNWRYRHLEIDIIATYNRTLHFIEVKTRTSNAYGGPELSVNWKKIARLRRAVTHYLQIKSSYPWVQLDVIAITISNSSPPLIELFEDVYG